MAGRRLVWGLVAALLAGACAERPPVDARATLVFKHAQILGPSDPIPALLREFEAIHPGIRVQSEALPWSSDEQHQLYVINLEGGSAGFDVMMLDVIWVPEFARAGWLLDLSPWAPDLSAFFPSAASASTWDGRVWALPWNMNVGVLYYRADLLAKYKLAPPVTFDELVAAVARVRAGEGDARLDGYLWQGKQYEGLTVNALEAFWADSTVLLGDDGRVLPDLDRAADALGFLHTLIARGISPAWTTAADEELTRRAFGDGRAVFLRNWPYALDLFEAEGSAVRGRVGLAPLPGRTRATAGVGATGGSHLGVSAHTRHPAEAVTLARFLTSERAEHALVAGALYPTRIALYADPTLVRNHPAMPRIRELMLAGRPRPVTPHYLLLSTVLQPELSAALAGQKSPAQAFLQARRRLEYFLASRR